MVATQVNISLKEIVDPISSKSLCEIVVEASGGEGLLLTVFLHDISQYWGLFPDMVER